MSKKLENSYLSTLCMELAMLIEAGIPPADSALMLYDDEQTHDGRVLINTLIIPLEKGATMAEAFKASGYFPKYLVTMAEIGERTGRLSATLKALSTYYDRQDRLSVAIKSAVLYPSILLIMMIAIVLILVVQVLPIFNDTFNTLGMQMSSLATALMNFGIWFKSASVAIICSLVGVIIAAVAFWYMAPPRQWMVDSIYNSWGHKGLAGEISALRFVSAMALTTASGLDVEESLEMAMAVSGGASQTDAKHRQCLASVREGASLSDALFKAGILTARDARMLILGSKSGMADVALKEIASRREQQVQDDIDRIVSRIEPILVAVSSVFIGVILLSVMLPLMGIMSVLE